MPDDPDALWKPGYSGGYRTPTPEQGTPPLEQWTVTFDSTRVGAVAATDEVVVAVAGRPGQVVALDRRDGGERWRRPASGDSTTGLDVVDGAVLTRHVDGNGRGSVVAHDAATGEPLWSDPLAVGERIDVFGDAVLLRTPDGATRIDPRTGRQRELGAVGTGAGPSDNVVRALDVGEARQIDLDGATATLLLDGATASVTLTFERS